MIASLKQKKETMFYGIDNIGETKCIKKKCQKRQGEGTRKNTVVRFFCYMWTVTIDCDQWKTYTVYIPYKLKTYTVNTKTITKAIQQKVIKKEIMCNKKYSLIQKEDNKNGNRWD